MPSGSIVLFFFYCKQMDNQKFQEKILFLFFIKKIQFFENWISKSELIRKDKILLQVNGLYLLMIKMTPNFRLNSRKNSSFCEIVKIEDMNSKLIIIFKGRSKDNRKRQTEITQINLRTEKEEKGLKVAQSTVHKDLH